MITILRRCSRHIQDHFTCVINEHSLVTTSESAYWQNQQAARRLLLGARLAGGMHAKELDNQGTQELVEVAVAYSEKQF